MEENHSKASYSVRLEDGVAYVDVKAQIDLVEIAKEKAKDTSNTIDDVFVKILEMAEKGLDWKGYAKEHVI